MPFDLSVYRYQDGTVRKYSDLGGYPIFYLAADNGVLCADCVERNRPNVPDDEQADDWRIVAADVNWEDEELICDGCNAKIAGLLDSGAGSNRGNNPRVAAVEGLQETTMNFIQRLKSDLEQRDATIATAQQEIQDFLAFLHSEKFTGMGSNGERKDWIATGDVISRLQELRAALQTR